MKKIAVDIVLLLPEKISKMTITLNLQDPQAVLRLNNKDLLPHISLRMGIVKEEDLENLRKVLIDLAKMNNPLILEMIGLKIYSGPGKNFLEIRKTNSLKNLFEDVRLKFKKWLKYDEIAPEMFHGNILDIAKLIRWVKSFENRTVNEFHPHITLFSTKSKLEKSVNLPIEFAASRLALCQLGERCTCRKILFEVKLVKHKSS